MIVYGGLNDKLGSDHAYLGDICILRYMIS